MGGVKHPRRVWSYCPPALAFVQNVELRAKRRTRLFLHPIFRAQMAKRLAFDDEARNWIL